MSCEFVIQSVVTLQVVTSSISVLTVVLLYKNTADVDRTDETRYAWKVVCCCQNTSDIASIQRVVSLLTPSTLVLYLISRQGPAIPQVAGHPTRAEDQVRSQASPYEIDSGLGQVFILLRRFAPPSRYYFISSPSSFVHHWY